MAFIGIADWLGVLMGKSLTQEDDIQLIFVCNDSFSPENLLKHSRCHVLAS